MAARQSMRRLAQQLRSSTMRAFSAQQPAQRSPGILGASERQGMHTLRACERSRLLRQRSNMMPTLVGRSSRSILAAWRAMHLSVSIFGLDDDGT
ncbi:hypothetical protein OEZ86_014232 [Tetradesmus obliquus]|uniref:Uncharacterized protein n=2 Tax=Tetradesmus obliquus TaxID=3088 RepID=A0A383VZC8_TETOB|nr:hypothetical protein OEZ85_013957 [Tetradesmus obliquus]WIA17051.1 hypothetical protein OEZ85_013957 [Tetradesmus obliquus]WIA17052.1 hypothetical protein OEZ85_013957 [Tetradesmus obliquus]WIA37292.1 hypothetical protein OEZ86_014232 [Tetradesmus obliquus]WIA37293.1 hypothetical protein OEZ86_014232 [Tetradesmus obliquus]